MNENQVRSMQKHFIARFAIQFCFNLKRKRLVWTIVKVPIWSRRSIKEEQDRTMIFRQLSVNLSCYEE